MIAALLLAAAAPAGAVQAERAFAADAQALGQWTAFRRWATADAVMFWPEPVNVQQKLRTLADPPHAVAWVPAESYVACDGTIAANTGPWRQQDGSIGYYSTVWVRQAAGAWRWQVDGGDTLAAPRWPLDVRPKVRRASCRPIPRVGMRAVVGADNERQGSGASVDGTLRWYWTVKADGARRFGVSLWNGRRFEEVIDDRIDAPGAVP